MKVKLLGDPGRKRPAVMALRAGEQGVRFGGAAPGQGSQQAFRVSQPIGTNQDVQVRVGPERWGGIDSMGETRALEQQSRDPGAAEGFEESAQLALSHRVHERCSAKLGGELFPLDAALLARRERCGGNRWTRCSRAA